MASSCDQQSSSPKPVPLPPTTESLSTLKCQEFFELEGFVNQSDFQQGLDIYLNNSSEVNPFISLLESMTELRFLTTIIPSEKNVGTILDLFEDCSKSEYKDLVLIGSIFKIGTELSEESRNLNSGQMNLIDLQNTISNGIDLAKYGSVVIDSYNYGCLSNLPIKNSFLLDFVHRYCKAIEKSHLISNTETQVGYCFTEYLKDPNYVCP